MLILLLHVSVAIEDVVAVRHGVFEIEQFVMQIAETAAAGDCFIEHRASAHFVDFLAEVSDGKFLRHRDGAVVRFFFAGDHAEKRRFAGAIRPDQSRFFARIELKGRLDEEDLLAVLLADAGKRNHVRATTSCRVIIFQT